MALSARLPLMGVEEAKELMQVVLGSKKADLAIINARLANVYTGELLDNYAVAIKGKWIAYVGKEPHDSIGPETVVIDAEGMTIIPGLIDGHAHLANIYDSSEFLRYAIKGGTTTIIAETMEAFPMGGYDGVLDYMESYADQPVKVYFTAAAMVSISRTCSGMPAETLKKLLQRDDIIGFGESYWQAVLQEPDQFLPLYNETIRCGKMVEGHSAGASGKKLMAYVAAGVSSCHEPISAEEVRERLRLGLYVMAREGSIRRELDAVSLIKNMNIDLRRLILVTDGVYPKDLLEKGYEEFVLQRAIECGFDPMEALRMVTLNAAERFALDGILGGIGPGKYADLVVLPDLRTIRAEYVISGGKIVAQKGEVLVEPRKHVYSKASLNSVHLPSKFKPEDFSLKINGDTPTKKIRIIDQVTDLVTKELTMVMPVIAGEIRADVKQDIIKVAAIDRTHNPGRSFVGLLRGFHMRSGAFATSVAWDTSDIIVVGVSDADMSLAVNRIHALQGGTVVCADGIIIAEFPMPVLGQISDLPMEELNREMEEIEAAVKGLGVPFANPFLTLGTLTGAAIPYLRICEEGLVNLKDGKTLDLVVSE